MPFAACGAGEQVSGRRRSGTDAGGLRGAARAAGGNSGLVLKPETEPVDDGLGYQDPAD